MKKIVEYVSIILALIITYIMYQDFKYVLLHIIFFVIISVITSVIAVLVIFTIQLLKKKFRFKNIFSFFLQRNIIFVIIISIVVSAPCFLIPITHHIFVTPFYSKNINNIPINYDVNVCVNDRSIVIIEDNIKVFLPDSRYKIIEKPMKGFVLIKSNNGDDFFWYRDDSDYDSKSNYLKLANEIWGNASERYYN